MDHLSEQDRHNLTTEFSMEEIKDVVFSMKHNKAPSPDEFPIEFHQQFWEIIKDDLKELFDDFHKGSLPIKRLNYG